MDIFWVILSGLGSMFIAIILGVSGFFLQRYVKRKDEKDDENSKTLNAMLNEVSLIKQGIINQNSQCDMKMKFLSEKIQGLDKITEDHEDRIVIIEKKIS